MRLGTFNRSTADAANTADHSAINAWSGWGQDSQKIGADFTKAAAGRAHTRDNKIADAVQTAVLVVNGEALTQAKANVVADKDFADVESGAWDDRIHDEADARRTL